MKMLCVLLPHFLLKCELQRHPEVKGTALLTHTVGSQKVMLDYSPELDVLRPNMSLQQAVAQYGEAEDGEQVVEKAEELEPDLVILDISMPRLNGFQATKRIKAYNPNTAILILTVHDDIEHLSGLLDVGANGYLTKDISDAGLINAIRKIISGETVIAPQLLKLLVKATSESRTNPDVARRREILSNRELEILKLAAKGLSNKSIAVELNLSPFTVKTYMAEIFSKINVSSRTEAVLLSIHQGLITIDET